jgi:hypothetical protein
MGRGFLAMLFKKDTLEGIAAKKVTLAFRRWKKPTVKAGGALMTAVGVVAFEAVEKTALTKITEDDAKAAGFATRAALLKEIAKHPGGDLYRIKLKLGGVDPRIALRQDGNLSKTEMKNVLAALSRLDQTSEHGPWTASTLRLIDKYPARRAPDLAASQRRDPMIFKRDVRKLKELGLTEALEIGYRLSLRGRVVLNAINSSSSNNNAASAGSNHHGSSNSARV